LVNERFIATVVRPTIADLQSELAAAGPDRLKRLAARWRGYCAFWTLLLVSPFALWSNDRPYTASDSVAVGSAIVTLVTVATLGAWIAFVAVAATLVAFLIHAWYKWHPSEIAMPPAASWRSPQIKVSSTEVGSNIGGLIFVVGSVLVVSLGVPSVVWFLVASTIAACFVAWGLAAWHTRARAEDRTPAGRRPRLLL
jgi:hypothetical protein